MTPKKTVVIIGAGPAGLTAAYELLTRTEMRVIVIEKDPQYVGGISRTVNYKGNRIDIGGHRFFSKSDKVMQWWSTFLPVSLPGNIEDTKIAYQNTIRALTDTMRLATDADGDEVFTVRPRKTRIIYDRTFFPYPVELSLDVLRKLGVTKTIRIGLTYLYAAIFPRRPEKTLEDFFINRFGTELYATFFKAYTEKVWGVPCTAMSAEWGAQRIKGLSVAAAISHAVKKVFTTAPLSGRSVETSLIEQFLYPTLGPGQLWDKVAQKVTELGGEIRMGSDVAKVNFASGLFESVEVVDSAGRRDVIAADYLFSSADIRTLLDKSTGIQIPPSAQETARALQYRDFITVGLLLENPPTEKDGEVMCDTWMYVHEESVRVGRIQFFHNWQPKLVANQKHGWLGLEYFCDEGDALWQTSDSDFIDLAKRELGQLGIAPINSVLDGTIIRQKKAYPGYFGSYANFAEVRKFLDTITNVFPIGRNGMHRYNNQDHSMLAAMSAVDLLILGETRRDALWEINTEDLYHEQK